MTVRDLLVNTKSAASANGADGAASTDEFVRVFMMPGMGHCAGGAGPDQADFMAHITSWVEKDDAPVRITARKLEGGKEPMSRPICAYPRVPRYQGRGDPNDEANFACEEGR